MTSQFPKEIGIHMEQGTYTKKLDARIRKPITRILDFKHLLN